MLAALLVVFREVLEASTYCFCGFGGNGRGAASPAFIGGGIGAGIIGSCIVALFTNQLANSFSGHGQELFNAGVMFAVVALLGWNIVWMQKHGREMVAEMREVGAAVKSGQKPLIVLATVVALAVLREGSEIVLFMHGMMGSGKEGEVLMGFAGGLALGIITGGILYWGFVKMPVGLLFSSTNFLLMLIAAGMAARGAGVLIQAGYLPSLQDPLWDSSGILSEDSFVGNFLHALIGYIAAPSGMQMVFYAATVLGISLLIALQKQKAVPSR